MRSARTGKQILSVVSRRLSPTAPRTLATGTFQKQWIYYSPMMMMMMARLLLVRLSLVVCLLYGCVVGSRDDGTNRGRREKLR